MMRLKTIFLVLPLLLQTAWAGVPDITLRDLDGKSRQLHEFVGNGKWTVVAIWAHDCHVCNAEIHNMEFFHNDHVQRDAQVLGVSIDGWTGVEQARTFIERHELGFPNLLIEPSMAELAKFGGGPFIGTPTFYVYDPGGEIVARQVGPLPLDVLEDFIRQRQP